MSKLITVGLCNNCKTYCRKGLYTSMWEKHKSTVEFLAMGPGIAMLLLTDDSLVLGLATAFLLPPAVTGVGDFLIDLKEKELENTCTLKK